MRNNIYPLQLVIYIVQRSSFLFYIFNSHRLLPGPFGLANGFFSSSLKLGVPAPLAGALSPPSTPNSALINASLISFGSEVSIFFGASTDEDSEPSIVLADANTPLDPEEYNILCLMGEEEGQAYMNTVLFV